jgi:hypothetical protein
MLNVLSLGAGVQSTTLALMAAHGEITPMPDCAIFADTGWEPKAVYDHLAWLMSPDVLPFPVHQVTIGPLREHVIKRSNSTGQRFAAVPWYVRMPDGGDAMGRRQCTKEYKLTPIRRKVRELLGGKTPKGGAQVWIGISTDEAMRMKPSQLGYIINRWPLIDHRMNRNDCLRWLEKHGYPTPPRSACIGCPYNSDRRWRDMRDSDPVSFADAVAVDAAIRNMPGFRGQSFMHRSMKPLDQVDLSNAEDRGQLNLFNNECEGMCGC